MVKWKVAQQAKSCSPIITAAAYIIFFCIFFMKKMLDIAFNCLQVLHMKHFKFVWLSNTAADGKKIAAGK